MRPVTVSVGPNAVGGTASPLVRLDEWAPGLVGIQVNVSGTVNYTVQSTMDDPNSPTNPVAAGSMTWVNSNDTNVVNATTTQQTNFMFAPIFVRVLLNSGTGTVTMTVVQYSNGPR